MAPAAMSFSDHGDSTWQLVNESSKLSQKSIRHRRGLTEAPKRLSMFKRSRSNTSMGHLPSPARSMGSQSAGQDNTDEARLESGWSDSDHSDSQTKSWMSKGSKMLRKKSSTFGLGSSRSSRRTTMVEDVDEADGPRLGLPLRTHGRMWSTVTDHIGQPNTFISQPFNFKHVNHTKPQQVTHLHQTSQDKLRSEFSAICASQEPQHEIQGIPTEEVRSPDVQSSRPVSRGSVTPPLHSPNRFHSSRSASALSIRRPDTLPRSRSIDNFSQPSPRRYRTPPASPPARSSSRSATYPAPDFFSEVHHATPRERVLLAQHNNPDQSVILPRGPALHHQMDDQNLPHALTTSDDIALTLKPSPVRRSSLLLADVPEEDELRSMRRLSNETFRPVTADATLRHATSFPSTDCFPRGRRTSRLSGVLPIQVHPSRESIISLDSVDDAEVSMRCRMSTRSSTQLTTIDPCWEESIDYCYLHEAEADCDFDWDRVSMKDTSTHHISQEATADPPTLTETLETVDAQAHGRSNSLNSLPRLQTSLPELSYSATSSAKSSMASLCGPLTPSHHFSSPQKSRPILQSSISNDLLDVDSAYLPWNHDDSFQKAPAWDHANNFNYPFNNLSLSGTSTRTSLRSSRPTPTTSRSSDNVLLSASSSMTNSRRNTSSSGSLPELICSRNYRQQTNLVAERIADRIAVLSATDSGHTAEVTTSEPGAFKNTVLHSILKKNTSSCGNTCPNEPSDLQSSTHAGAKDQSVSMAAIASKLRSSSITSNSSGSSSQRASRVVSYSLFPSVPSGRI